jgi:hypothetical protein
MAVTPYAMYPFGDSPTFLSVAAGMETTVGRSGTTV